MPDFTSCYGESVILISAENYGTGIWVTVEYEGGEIREISIDGLHTPGGMDEIKAYLKRRWPNLNIDKEGNS